VGVKEHGCCFKCGIFWGYGDGDGISVVGEGLDCVREIYRGWGIPNAKLLFIVDILKRQRSDVWKLEARESGRYMREMIAKGSHHVSSPTSYIELTDLPHLLA
jgi:hypothetical protein